MTQGNPAAVAPASSPFHVLTVGWGLDVIRRLADPIEDATGFRFSHVVDSASDLRELPKSRSGSFFRWREDLGDNLPEADLHRLADLEQPGVPTIHNMILSDRVIRHLDYGEALAFASYLAGRLEELFRAINPNVVLGGYDSVHSGIALAVARKMGIPWFALSFTTIPYGLTGFCTGMSPDTTRSFLRLEDHLRATAEQTLSDFEGKRFAVRAYLSANNFSLILKRFPGHIRVFFRAINRIFNRRFDKFTQYPPRRLAAEYLRKRVNIMRLPKKWFIESPPSRPYLFFGLQMQPESSLDVWAPFFADQFAVIEVIARSMPPTHALLVKLHKSDADNYSPRQLNQLRRLPGVQLVSPYVMSRDFIEDASLVLAIQGNIAIEAALLGRPVLVFGDSGFVKFPSVMKVKRITDLPAQIREALAMESPGREAIVNGFISYLSGYAPGCYNDWRVKPSQTEVDALAEHFRALRDSLENTTTAAEAISDDVVEDELCAE